MEPKLLDYDNAQFLLIGESADKAFEQRPKDEREGNAPPEEEMEKLEGEDEIRIKHLKGKSLCREACIAVTNTKFQEMTLSLWTLVSQLKTFPRCHRHGNYDYFF